MASSILESSSYNRDFFGFATIRVDTVTITIQFTSPYFSPTPTFFGMLIEFPKQMVTEQIFFIAD